MSQLTEVTIRSRTQTGDTPLHRAAKNGKFAEIPAHLLSLELFLEKNSREETPLHIAAKHGNLTRVPSEFLTTETLTALDYYGRTPLHVAADYRHADQIPDKFLSTEVLGLQTKNFRSETILHLAAATNTLHLIPEDRIIPKLLEIRNGYGLTPLETLEEHLPTQRQLDRLREMRVTFEETELTRERADGLIEAQNEKVKRAPLKLQYERVNPSGSSPLSKPSASITLLAKRSSGGDPYKVDFAADGPDLRVLCHCRAGRGKFVCKHVVALASGDSDMLFGADEDGAYEIIKSWPQFAVLKQRTQAFLAELSNLETELARANSDFMGWYSANQSKKRPQGEGLRLVQFLLPGEDRDPEVRRRFKELENTSEGLKDQMKSLKQWFMQGLRLGFHRI